MPAKRVRFTIDLHPVTDAPLIEVLNYYKYTNSKSTAYIKAAVAYYTAYATCPEDKSVVDPEAYRLDHDISGLAPYVQGMGHREGITAQDAKKWCDQMEDRLDRMGSSAQAQYETLEKLSAIEDRLRALESRDVSESVREAVRDALSGVSLAPAEDNTQAEIPVEEDAFEDDFLDAFDSF